MRATELLAATVVDTNGAGLGPVRDVRVAAGGADRFRVVGLVVGGGRFARIAHTWGYPAGRAVGPWALRALFADATRRARYVPADRVVDWDAREIRIDVAADELRPLAEVDAE